MACRWRQSSSRPKFPKLQREKLALKWWLAAFLHKNEDGWSLQFFCLFSPLPGELIQFDYYCFSPFETTNQKETGDVGRVWDRKMYLLATLVSPYTPIRWDWSDGEFLEVKDVRTKKLTNGEYFFSSKKHQKTIASSTSVKHFQEVVFHLFLQPSDFPTWRKTIAGWCSHFSRAGYLWHPFRAQGRMKGWRLILKHPGWTVFKKELLNNGGYIEINCYDWQPCSLNICL